MADTVHFHSQVGSDGVLNLQVNLGQAEANKEVVVTIAPAAGTPAEDPHALNWHDFLERTYGSCEGLGVELPEQLPLEDRDPIE
jgi:hypothetical protein